MLVGDLNNYIFDEVVLYRENPKVDGEYIDIHKGFICTSPISILNLEVRTIGAKRKGVVDIRVKQKGCVEYVLQRRSTEKKYGKITEKI